ncbi:hypothetical protein [Nocardioides sp.]|uniref:hypothetical protein n=1 Tax=Nocardioides sp. TaxID=35761 RepID=UPI002629649E|nr:hypothetical protein [Nocardioides sp.]
MSHDAAALGGEITTFLAALGQHEDSLELLEVITLAGPRMERHERVQDGVTWTTLVFAPQGVTVQIRDGVIVAIRIDIVDEDGGVYGQPQSLIAGLSLPATKAELRAVLGAPTQALDSLDLFRLGDRYLSADLAGDQVVAVSVLLSGVAPA